MTSLLNATQEGLLFIISAPAGTGKTTLVQRLVEEFPSIVTSISYTTRKPREGEIHGIHYHFVTEPEFEAKIAAADFIEYVKLYGIYYGTSRQWVKEKQQQGKYVVLVIDTQGAIKIRELFSAISIFIYPPSLEILQQRLIQRQTESIESLTKRLEWAQREVEVAACYDYQFINDDLEVAYQILRSIIIAESYRTIHVSKKKPS